MQTTTRERPVRDRAAIEPPVPIARGVWRIRGGFPVRSTNVYLVEDRDGLVAFDAGTRPMGRAIARLLGGRLRRVVLGHAHADHRGGAATLGVPVLCHAAEAAQVAGPGAAGSFERSSGGVRGVPGCPLPFAGRWLPRLMRLWDGGPVPVAGTLGEGERVADFEVVHLPGHTPGSIALWRRADRVALTSDAFYAFGEVLPRPGAPRLPTEHFTADPRQAAGSLRKLAALAPAAAWPGHFGPVTGDVSGALEAAAEVLK